MIPFRAAPTSRLQTHRAASVARRSGECRVRAGTRITRRHPRHTGNESPSR